MFITSAFNVKSATSLSLGFPFSKAVATTRHPSALQPRNFLQKYHLNADFS